MREPMLELERVAVDETMQSASPVISNDEKLNEIYHLSVEQYHAMADAGIFADDERVELLDGRLFRKMTKHPPHSTVNRRLRFLFSGFIGEGSGYLFDSQEPITLAGSIPEPDLWVARGQIETFATRHPRANEVVLVIEVSDSTLQLDRGLKKRIYAEAKISEYWLINIPQQQVEIFTQPQGKGKQATYTEQVIRKPGELISVRIGGQEVGQIAVAELFA